MCKKTIYVITGMSGIVTNIKDNYTRTFGWFDKVKQAKNAVVKNAFDMRECLYNYMVIEEIKSGIFPVCKKRWWFVWDYKDKKYKVLKKDPCPSFINFALG